MPKTEVRGAQIKDTSVQRADLDTSTTGQAVTTRIIAGTNINIGSTGVDTGTGDVTINMSAVLTGIYGGTGFGTTAVGDLLQGTTANAWSKLASVAAGSYLRSGGVTTASAWSTVKLPDTMSALGLWVANSANTTVNLTAAAGQSVRVNAGGTAWEAYTPGVGTIGGSITDNQIAVGAATSNNIEGSSALTFDGSILATTGTIQAINFRDANSATNVNLANGGTEGRGVVAGYSSSDYPGIGYNIRTTINSGQWTGISTDTASLLSFKDGGYEFRGWAGGTAGRALTTGVLAVMPSNGELTLYGPGLGMTGSWDSVLFLNAQYPVIRFLSNNSKYAGIGYDAGGGMYWWLDSASGDISTTNVKMHLNNSGRLALGTSSPGYSLDVYDATGAATLNVRTESAIQVGIRISRTVNSASTWEMYVPWNATDLRFYNGGQDRLKMSTSGALDFASGQWHTAGTHNRIYFGGAGGSTYFGTGSAYIFRNSNDIAVAAIGFGDDDVFRWGSQSATGNPYMSIWQGGVEVAGTRRAYIQWVNGGGLYIAAEYNTLNLMTGGATRLSISGSGDVGIGTTTTNALEVYRTNQQNLAVFRQGTSTNYSSIRLINDTNNMSRSLEIDYSGSAYGGALLTSGPTGESGAIATTGNYPLVFGTNNTARIIIKGDGNVGIGVSPSAPLVVYGGDGTYNATNFGTSARGAIHIRFSGTSDRRSGITWSQASADDAQAGIYVHQDNSNGTHMYLATTNSYATGPQARVWVLNNGNVGIGASPSYKLDVDGRLRAGYNAGDGNSGIWYEGSLATEWFVGLYDNSTFGWYYGAWMARMDSTGRLALGQDATSSTSGVGLTVNLNTASQGSYIRAQNTNANELGIIFDRTGTGATTWYQYLKASNATDLYFYNGADRFSFATNGAFVASGDVTGYGTPSDESLKENVVPIRSATDILLALRPVSFNWKEGTKEREMVGLYRDHGFIAQDVQFVLPDLVRKNTNGLLSLRAQGIIPYLVKGFSEHDDKIKALETKIEELENKINFLMNLYK